MTCHGGDPQQHPNCGRPRSSHVVPMRANAATPDRAARRDKATESATAAATGWSASHTPIGMLSQ
eukprot:5373829-Alexandrium_andersonii.AAC.1